MQGLFVVLALNHCQKVDILQILHVSSMAHWKLENCVCITGKGGKTGLARAQEVVIGLSANHRAVFP